MGTILQELGWHSSHLKKKPRPHHIHSSYFKDGRWCEPLRSNANAISLPSAAWTDLQGICCPDGQGPRPCSLCRGQEALTCTVESAARPFDGDLDLEGRTLQREQFRVWVATAEWAAHRSGEEPEEPSPPAARPLFTFTVTVWDSTGNLWLNSLLLLHNWQSGFALLLSSFY